MSIDALLAAKAHEVPPAGGRRAAPHDTGVRTGIVAGLGRLADGEAHDLANLLVGITFCLERLRGHQSIAELEEVVERALEGAAQGVESARALLLATRALAGIADDESIVTRPTERLMPLASAPRAPEQE